MFNELIGKVFESDDGEQFKVSGYGSLLAKRVKREGVTLDTSKGPLTGALVIDFDDKIGIVGKDGADTYRVMVRQDGDWVTGTLHLKDPNAEDIEFGVGSSGFESKELNKIQSVKVLSKEEYNQSEGKSPQPEFVDKDIVQALLESLGKEGSKVRIRNNTMNREMHPELIGKIGRIVQEYHTPHGLYYDVMIDGTEQVEHLDWRDVEQADVATEQPQKIDTGGQSFTPNESVNEVWNAETMSGNLGAQAGMKGVSPDISDEEIRATYGPMVHKSFNTDINIPVFREMMAMAPATKKAHRPVNIIVNGKPATDKPFTSSAAAVQYAMYKLPQDAKYDLVYAD